jgi:outer membrane receptor protein involved in Fe transport
LVPRASITTAVLLALYGVPQRGTAQQSQSVDDQAKSQAGSLQEVIVTANRRNQAIEDVPYNISVIGASQLSNTGVTDIASLTYQVPGLSTYDLGARTAGATTPNIRGMNVTAAPTIGQVFRTSEQSPVGVYIGNSPIDGYLQLQDVQRVEVLRGPQGTLYGAGALGGALRIIPHAPEFGSLTGSLELGGGTVAHSSDLSYTASGMLNVPIGETLAFRASGGYVYAPGFIDVYGILKRSDSSVFGTPILANPADPVMSPGIYTGKDDWNHQGTFTGRASLAWRPADRFNAELGYLYSHVTGDGGPAANPVFPGGPYPIDPRVTFPSGGDYKFFTAVDQPFSRRTDLTSLDLSYDAGFATISGTSSYYTTDGSTMVDATYANAAFAFVIGYYAGTPTNPRYVSPELFTDNAHTFTQEVRLVSTTGPDKKFDYVVGIFYEHQQRDADWILANPGSREYSEGLGCTAPYYFGATFPNCLVNAGPNDTSFHQTDAQTFRDISEFGELTWHYSGSGQATVGIRHFQQDYTDTQSYAAYGYGIVLPPETRTSNTSRNTGKASISYKYARGQNIYALWSQGFRRGGSNAIPLGGPVGEQSPSLLTYSPDSANNYELGLKGVFSSGLSYTFDVFDIEWDNPQVAGTTPIGNLAVWNAKKARSRGVEGDLSTPLFVPGLAITLSATYVNATLTEDYSIPADVFGNITGKAGQQLPGSAKTSAAGTINYGFAVAPRWQLNLSLNGTYRSAMFLSTFPVLGQPSPLQTSGMFIGNASASIAHEAWQLGLYITNLADRRVILGPPNHPDKVGYLTNSELINRPRQIDLRLKYSF